MLAPREILAQKKSSHPFFPLHVTEPLWYSRRSIFKHFLNVGTTFIDFAVSHSLLTHFLDDKKLLFGILAQVRMSTVVSLSPLVSDSLTHTGFSLFGVASRWKKSREVEN